MRALIPSVLLVWCVLGAADAAAQSGADIDLQTFRPAMDSRGYITVNASDVLGHKELSFGLVTNWGKDLLRFEDGSNHYRVEHMVTPTLVGALGLRAGWLRAELGVSVPFGVMAGDRDPDRLGAPDDPNDDMRFGFEGQGMGDVGLHTKIRLWRAAHMGVAVLGSVHVPTATQSRSWLGSGSLSPQVMAVIDAELGRFKLAVNGGVKVRADGVSRFRDDMDTSPEGLALPTTGGTIAVGATLPVGAGIAYALAPQRFDVVAEVFGQVPLEGENYQPVEAVAGIKVYLAQNSYLSLGGGAGLLRERPGNPDVRAFMGIVFEPKSGDRDGDGIADQLDACPDDPEDFDDFSDADGCPDLDNDQDGILDEDDQCRNEPEDRDGHDDDDGCPDGEPGDRDGDGILDADDACPDDPEDLDGFEDQDGCPDPDNDQDGILDVDDLCPDEAEDFDQWEDEDGCPEADNDRDRILDVDDDCPLEPETYNTVDDDDGCPDRGIVGVGDGELTVLKKVYFEFNSAVIKEESHELLGTVAATINLNPELALIEVQGHTDARGSEDYNMRLSQARAESVVEFLVAQGVSPDRLRARGYGESKPRARGNNRAAWAKNRRVEFVIVERSE